MSTKGRCLVISRAPTLRALGPVQHTFGISFLQYSSVTDSDPVDINHREEKLTFWCFLPP